MKKIIRLKTVIEMTGLSRSTIYDYMARGLFPRQITLGENSRGWLYSEVDEWLESRIQKRDEQNYDE
ncbi:AlpA family transcriptional regulator [Francisellaceae bacterium CB52]|jgi:prophage regulatory protein